MSELLQEELISLAQARHLVPGKRPHLSALYRWAQKGVRGVRLESVLIGGSRYTSRQALHRFFAQVTAAAHTPAAAPVLPSPAHRTQAAQRAAADLARRGF